MMHICFRSAMCQAMDARGVLVPGHLVITIERIQILPLITAMKMMQSKEWCLTP